MNPGAVALLVLSLIASCTEQPKQRLFKQSAAIMDTVVSITVVADSEIAAGNAIEAAFGEIRRLEELLSFWTEDSEIAAIYRNAGARPTRVSPETRELIEKALYVAKETSGAFDPTVGPLMRLWDFREEKMPTTEEIESRIGLVDWKKVEVDVASSEAFLKVRGMSFDTGGIAKGYAVDRAVQALKANGIKSGLVAIAGDIRAFGSRPGGKPWRIGIRDPRPEGKTDDILATIELRDEAISTSGDYERYFVKGGVLYHHILDPATGQPARGSRSVSVIAKKAVDTDGFSTGVFVLGPEEGLKVLGRLGMEGVVVSADGTVMVTPGIRDRIKFDD